MVVCGVCVFVSVSVFVSVCLCRCLCLCVLFPNVYACPKRSDDIYVFVDFMSTWVCACNEYVCAHDGMQHCICIVDRNHFCKYLFMNVQLRFGCICNLSPPATFGAVASTVRIQSDFAS